MDAHSLMWCDVNRIECVHAGSQVAGMVEVAVWKGEWSQVMMFLYDLLMSLDINLKGNGSQCRVLSKWRVWEDIFGDVAIGAELKRNSVNAWKQGKWWMD